MYFGNYYFYGLIFMRCTFTYQLDWVISALLSKGQMNFTLGVFDCFKCLCQKINGFSHNPIKELITKIVSKYI